eukprot:gene20234-26986_t
MSNAVFQLSKLQKPALLRKAQPNALTSRKPLVCKALNNLPSTAPLTRTIRTSTISSRTSTVDIMSTVQDWDAEEDDSVFENYSHATTMDLFNARFKWLVFFSVGLVVSAAVDFDELLQQHPSLSFFLPLIIGYAGNSGSQTTCAIIRALALKQVSYNQIVKVVAKESAAGAMMGSMIGCAIFCVTQASGYVSADVGFCVALSLPLVSVWSNALGAFLALTSDKLKFDAALTAAPLMTTIVDSTGLVIYFIVSDHVIRGNWTGAARDAVMAIMSAPSLPH